MEDRNRDFLRGLPTSNALMAVDLAACLLGAKAAAEARREAMMASFMVKEYILHRGMWRKLGRTPLPCTTLKLRIFPPLSFDLESGIKTKTRRVSFRTSSSILF